MAREVHQYQCAVCAAGEDGVTQAAHRQINVLLSQLNEVHGGGMGGRCHNSKVGQATGN